MNISIAKAGIACAKTCASHEPSESSFEDLRLKRPDHVVIDRQFDTHPLADQAPAFKQDQSLDKPGIIDRRSGTITLSDHFDSGSSYTATDDLWQFSPSSKLSGDSLSLRSGFRALAESQSPGFDQKANQLMQGMMSAHLTRI